MGWGWRWGLGWGWGGDGVGGQDQARRCFGSPPRARRCMGRSAHRGAPQSYPPPRTSLVLKTRPRSHVCVCACARVRVWARLRHGQSPARVAGSHRALGSWTARPEGAAPPGSLESPTQQASRPGQVSCGATSRRKPCTRGTSRSGSAAAARCCAGSARSPHAPRRHMRIRSHHARTRMQCTRFMCTVHPACDGGLVL